VALRKGELYPSEGTPPAMTTQTPAPIPTPAPAASTPRAVWIAIMLLTATLVAVAAGFLAYAGGARIPTAVLTGGGAFAGTVALLLALLTYATGGRAA
jgi:hypothetical protein